jgi:hypothetical protein
MSTELTVIAPTTLAEAVDYAKMMAATNMVPKHFVGKPYDIVVATQYGASLGLAPLQALQSIAVINGMPCLWGDGLLSVAMSDPQFAGMDETSSGSITTGDYSATCVVRRARFGKIQETRREFTQAMAKRAGLLGKQGPWTQYPERMFQMRARGFAIRDAFADALKGFKSAEEQMDIIDATTGEVTERPTNVVDADYETKAEKPAAEPAKKPKGNAAMKAKLMASKAAAPASEPISGIAAAETIEEPNGWVDEIISGIAAAETIEELNGWWSRVNELESAEEKDRVQAAGKARLSDFNEAKAPR